MIGGHCMVEGMRRNFSIPCTACNYCGAGSGGYVEVVKEHRWFIFLWIILVVVWPLYQGVRW